MPPTDPSPLDAAARRETQETCVLSLCAGGHQYPLVWRHRSEQQPVPNNAAHEMWLAGGGMDLAEWNGFCARCGAAVEWSTDRPREERPKRRFGALVALSLAAAMGVPMAGPPRSGLPMPSQATPSDRTPDNPTIIPNRIRRAAEKRARRAARRQS